MGSAERAFEASPAADIGVAVLDRTTHVKDDYAAARVVRASPATVIVFLTMHKDEHGPG